MLNLLNVTLHMYLIDCLLGGEFSTYGIEVFNAAKIQANTSEVSSKNFWPIVFYPFVCSQNLNNTYFILAQVLSFAMEDDEDRFDPMRRIFPKVTKCTFHNFGSSGTIQR